MSDPTKHKQIPAAASAGETSRSAVDPLQLQAYFDEELSTAEANEIKALLNAESPTPDMLRLSALSEMSELVRFENEQAVEDFDLSGLWGRIDEATEPASAPAEPVKRAAPASSAGGGGWFDRMRAFFDAQRAVFVPAMVMAAAALLVLIPLLGNQTPQMPSAESAVEEATPAVAETPDPVIKPEVRTVDTKDPKTSTPNLEDPNVDSKRPIIIMIQPPNPDDEWMLKTDPSEKSTNPPVIWLFPDKKSGEDPQRLMPNTNLWPVVQQLLQGLPETLPDAPANEKPGVLNGEPPRQGPI